MFEEDCFYKYKYLRCMKEGISWLTSYEVCELKIERLSLLLAIYCHSWIDIQVLAHLTEQDFLPGEPKYYHNGVTYLGK